MKVEKLESLFHQSIVNKYLQGDSLLAPFFDFSFQNSNAYLQRSQWLDQNTMEQRCSIADLLMNYNQSLGGIPQAIDSIEKVKNPLTLAVVTGQQAGLLTGPLYTIYKAISCIKVARAQSTFLGRPVVPIFWIASEDHNVAEVSSIHIAEKDRLLELAVSYEEKQRVALGYRQIPMGFINVVEQLLGSAPETAKREEWSQGFAFAVEAQSPDEIFARILHRLLGPYGLIIVNPLYDGFKERSADFFSCLIEKAEIINASYQESVTNIHKIGLPVQVKKDEDNAHLFIYEHKERKALKLINKGFACRDGSASWSKEELSNLIKQHPWRLSMNVVTRPLWQDWLLPTLAYIAGPGEIAYFALLRKTYSSLGMKMPVIVPRESYTLLEPSVQRIMRKYDVSIDLALKNMKMVRQDRLEQIDNFNVDSFFANFTEKLISHFEDNAEHLVNWDKGMECLVKDTKRRIFNSMDFLHRKTKAQQMERASVFLRHIQMLDNNICPFGKPQERVFNFFPYLLKYPYLLEEMISLPMDSLNHQIIFFH